MMKGLNKWLVAALVVVMLGGMLMAIGLTSARAVVVEEKVPAGDHWRNFDGHWSFWHDGDKRWYYTDGTHWYYHDGLHWLVYRFDRLFGKTGFHHGPYKAPAEHVKIEVPRHDVFKHR